MAKAVMEKLSAAEQYTQLKEAQFERFLEQSFSSEALKGVDLFEVTVPSGMKFKCRKLGPEYLSHGGLMPMSLADHIVAGTEPPESAEEKTELVRSMTRKQRLAGIEATAQMVRYITVEPRLIVGEVNGHKNAISADALTIADFNHLGNWAQGGEAAEGLKTFRRKRR